MKVYLVFVEVDAYPEDGGGLQGVEKVFLKKEDAKQYCFDRNVLTCGEYGDQYYFVEERWAE